MLIFDIVIDALFCKVEVEEPILTGMLVVRSLFCSHLSSVASFPLSLLCLSLFRHQNLVSKHGLLRHEPVQETK